MARRQDHFLLAGGLDLVTSVLSVPNGRLLAVKNYEPVEAGYGRMAGYERFDGRPSPSDASYSVFRFVDEQGTGRSMAGSSITGLTSGATAVLVTDPVAVVEDGSGRSGAYIVSDISDVAFEDNEVLEVSGGPGGVVRARASGTPQREAADTLEIHETWLKAAAAHRRMAIAQVPGSGPVRGVWVYRAELYAFRDNAGGTAGVMHKATPSGWTAMDLGGETLPAGGQYEFRNHNFLGQANSRKMYGVNGEGPAFEWDGSTFTEIQTGLSEAREKPRHLAIHRNHLFLAYPGGSLQNSETGNPLGWTAGGGAAEIGTGQEINGLIEGVGAGNVVVLGSNTIQILYGNDADDWVLATQSGEDAGAIRWTGQMIDMPVYMDNRGIRSIATTQQYANFNIGTASFLVQPWVDAQRSRGNQPTTSMRVRAKDMYRLFFDTKVGLSIYFGRKKPECSLIEFDHVVRCSCAFEADNGDERIFFGSDDGWVFEAEKGRSFDGEPIEAFARAPYNHLGSPSHDIRFLKADLYLEVLSRSSLRVGASFDYGDNPVDFLLDERPFYGGGAQWDEAFWDDFYWDSPLETRAAFHFGGVGSNVSMLTYSRSDAELSHVLTGMTMHYSPRRLRR